MRPSFWMAVPVAVFALAFASTGCNKSCEAAYDYTLTVDVSGIANASMPCSKCGGVAEKPYFECQSTCAAFDAGSGDAATNTDPSLTCTVDVCVSSLAAKGATCNTLCATLYPGKTLNSCSLPKGSTVVTCSLHQPEVCN